MREKGTQLKKHSNNEESAEFKLQKNQYMHVYQRYMEAISQHQVAKTNFKEISADRLVQRARVVFPDKSDEELRRVCCHSTTIISFISYLSVILLAANRRRSPGRTKTTRRTRNGG